jgi:hypothetical protein
MASAPTTVPVSIGPGTVGAGTVTGRDADVAVTAPLGLRQRRFGPPQQSGGILPVLRIRRHPGADPDNRGIRGAGRSGGRRLPGAPRGRDQARGGGPGAARLDSGGHHGSEPVGAEAGHRGGAARGQPAADVHEQPVTG